MRVQGIVVVLYLRVEAFRWLNFQRDPKASDADYDVKHPFEQPPQAPVRSERRVFITTQDVCRNLDDLGTNVCSMCSCLNWQHNPPEGCVPEISDEDLLTCLKKLSNEGGAHYGFMVTRDTLSTRFGCHGYGTSDKEVQYYNPQFREKMFSAWFRSPTGMNMHRGALMFGMNGTFSFTWAKQRQVCDGRKADDLTAAARVGFRSNPDNTSPLGRDPHQACIFESPNYTAEAHIHITPNYEWRVSTEIPARAFADHGAWLGPDDWFAIDVAIPHPCPANQSHLEPFMTGDVYDATVNISYPLMWLNPFSYDFWYTCCALPPSPSQAGAILDQSQNGVYTYQWVRDGGILRGVDPVICEYLTGQVIQGTSECLALSPGTYAPLGKLVQYDWQ